MLKTVIHSPAIDSTKLEILKAAFSANVISKNGFYLIEHKNPLSHDELDRLRKQLSLDVNTLPEEFDPSQIALLITDMDSTLISIECVDEIADFLNIKDKVSEITESAMRGEIDFNTSLKKRVSLLNGLDYAVLNRVYLERLSLNPGAEELMTGLRNRNIKTALVSGGFTFFTDRLKERLKFDYTLSNTLEVVSDKLTGNVSGEVVNGAVKAAFLQQLSTELDIDVKHAIAVGDGANDLPMLGLSGLGVAYRAKPIVQQQADVVLNYSALDAILDFLNLEST